MIRKDTLRAAGDRPYGGSFSNRDSAIHTDESGGYTYSRSIPQGKHSPVFCLSAAHDFGSRQFYRMAFQASRLKINPSDGKSSDG